MINIEHSEIKSIVVICQSTVMNVIIDCNASYIKIMMVKIDCNAFLSLSFWYINQSYLVILRSVRFILESQTVKTICNF